MRPHSATFVALLLAGTAPSTAHARGPVSFTLEAWGGIQRVDPLRVVGGTATVTPSSDDLLARTVDAFGVSFIAKTSFLEVGLSVDSSFTAPRTTVSTLTPMAGFAVDLSVLRLELLAEYGGHRYGSIAGSKERTTVAFAGVRPGISVRFPFAGPVRLVLGAWFLARWNVSSYDAAVTAPPPAVGTTVYRNGLGPTLGVVGRVGFEF